MSPGFKTGGMLRREHTEKQRRKKVTSYVDMDKGQSKAVKNCEEAPAGRREKDAF